VRGVSVQSSPSKVTRGRRATARPGPRVAVGVSGWSYGGWRGPFYPADLPARRQLEYVGRRFNSVEVNASFYGLLKPETCRAWYAAVPRGFRFAVKGSRFITHGKKLRDVEIPLANFFASGILLLGEKLGPIVWQLDRHRAIDPGRLETFLRLLPRDTEAAARLAGRHDHRLRGRSWTRTDRRRPLRHALEVRHEGSLQPDLVRVLRRHRVALVVSDSGDWPRREEITAGFVYVRLHGSPHTYASPYEPGQLDQWACRIRRWGAGGEPEDARRITGRPAPPARRRDVYVYLDNDRDAHAPRDALALAARLA
jgi:uncharacterized protein YecE (DUF72 family)